MGSVTDDQLVRWTKPAFGNEEAKATETERLIREAVQQHELLNQLDVRVFAKGSFKNNTNVRRDSDVDVGVEYQGLIRLEYADGAGFEHTGLQPYSGPFAESGVGAFKAAVGEAMRNAFGHAAVDGSGNKVFVVRESSRSLAADVVPCTTYQYTWPSGKYQRGIELILDRPDGRRHSNYPDQHYANGVAKNESSSKRFKRTVRILKNIENQLVADRLLPEIPSYFIECLAYNVSDPNYLEYGSWREIVQAVCARIWRYCKEPEPDDESDRWLEVNGCEFLFHPDQSWTRSSGKTFAALAFDMASD